MIVSLGKSCPWNQGNGGISGEMALFQAIKLTDKQRHKDNNTFFFLRGYVGEEENLRQRF